MGFVGILALIGATALYLLFAWLLSAAAAAWVADRKGYGERFGLGCGLLLSVIGLLLVLVLPARPHSRWKLDGPLPGVRGPGRGGDRGAGGSPGGGAGPS